MSRKNKNPGLRHKTKNISQKSDYIKHKDLDRSGEIALYYGFTCSETPEVKKVDIEQSKSLLEGDFVEYDSKEDDAKLPLHVEEKVALLRTYLEKKMFAEPQPVMLYFKNPHKGSIVSKKNNVFPRYCDLEIIGSEKSISEAILIKTSVTIIN
jgi:hypothetical protein